MKISSNILTLMATLVVSYGMAQSTQEKGLAIAQKANQADEGFVSSEVDLKMILRNKQGQESQRLLKSKTLELTEDGDKSMVVFNSPKDVEGTATLTFTHKQGPDDQWLYLPSIKRVKRISSSNKSGPFMGSEFAYEDLSSDEVEKYTYQYLEESTLNGEEVVVVEQYPVDTKSGYQKRVAFYNPNRGYRMEKIEFYDRKGAPLKTLTYSGYHQYLDKHWRANTFSMVNHQTDKETELFFSNYVFQTALSEDDFSQNALIRAGR